MLSLWFYSYHYTDYWPLGCKNVGFDQTPQSDYPHNIFSLCFIIIEQFECLCLLELVQKASRDDSRDFLFYLAVANYRLKVCDIPKLHAESTHSFSYQKIFNGLHLETRILMLINIQ